MLGNLFNSPWTWVFLAWLNTDVWLSAMDDGEWGVAYCSIFFIWLSLRGLAKTTSMRK